MPRATVFDTNVYQSLSRDQMGIVSEAELERDVLAYADMWVTMELLSKLANPETLPHGRAAVTKQWCHCGGQQRRGIVECEEQLCRLLLRKAPAGHAETRDALSQAAGRVATASRTDDLADVIPRARELKDHLDYVERDRADTILESFVRLTVPDAESWDAIATNPAVRQQVLEWIDRGDALIAMAKSEVIRAYKDVDEPIPDPIPEDHVDFLVEHFRYPLEVEVAVIRGVAERGWNLTGGGRQNAVWDAQIAFNAGQPVDGRTVTLVTDDALLLSVATATGESNVCSRADYLRALGVAE